MTAQPQALHDPQASIALRRALGAYATGVTVVTARMPDGQALGMTVNSFTSVSLDPPLVLWAVQSNSPNLAAWLAADRFAVNVLGEGEGDLALAFARRGADKFAGVPTRAGLGGVPLLDAAIAWFDCALHQIHPAGDHHLMIGRVEAFEARAGAAPLLFHGGRFGGLAGA